MWRTQYQIRINSSPEIIWRILMDLDHYSEWNRYATSARGSLIVGGQVEIVAHLGQSIQRVNNQVLEIIPNQRFCWKSLNWYQFLASGVRCRYLELQPDNTTIFREEETLSGPLAGIVERFYKPQMTEGLRIECESLKAEAERQMNTSTSASRF